MIVLYRGLPKSASTFEYHLAAGAVETAGFEQRPLYAHCLPEHRRRVRTFNIGETGRRTLLRENGSGSQ